MSRIFGIQGIEVSQATNEFKLGEETYPAGSYIIRAGQPYWSLAKNLLEKQDYPDERLSTYDDSGWTMGGNESEAHNRLLLGWKRSLRQRSVRR
jgi:hypothetical protein